MVKRSKISHFAPVVSSDPEAAHKRYPDKSRLAKLYPQPKTYEQRKQDDIVREQAYRRRWPKYPYLNIAAYGSALFGVVVWFAQNLNEWWFSGGADYGKTMSVTFFSFAIGIGVFFLIMAWISYVSNQFSYFGGSLQIFWLIYPLEAGALFTFWVSGFLWHYTNLLWVPVLAVLHFIIVCFSVKRILPRR